MNRNKFAKIVLIGLATILGAGPVFATQAPETPSCNIKGTISSVKLEEDWEAPCLKERGGCPTDMPTTNPALYSLDVKINSVAHIQGDTGWKTCDTLYPIGSTQNINIYKNAVKVGDVFSANQAIEGVVLSGSGKSFYSYSLKDPDSQSSYLVILGIIFGVLVLAIIIYKIISARRPASR